MTIAFATAAISAVCPAGALAETRALVVGVSGYPKLPERVRLTGPKNDSRAVAAALTGLGVPAGNVALYADGASGLPEGVINSGPATKEAILSGLDLLAETSKPGDLVVFYFSGHGSQQPDDDGDEQGGNDEVFLPYDTGKWTGAGVEGAIKDDELGDRVQRILDSGANFFGVIDACASATGFRDLADDSVKVRRVPPETLGVPESRSIPAQTGAQARLLGRARDGGEGRGRAAFFYAAQETEEALEMTPKGATDGESYGVFTFNLLRRLNENPGLSYRRLHQAVVSDIKRGTLMATQTPELEGTLLDEPALGEGAATAARQWPIYNGQLSAGALDGLAPGAVVALFDDAAAPDQDAVARGVVDAAGATKSQVSPLDSPDEAVWKKGRWARLVEPGVDFTLTLSEPVRVDPSDGRDYGPALAALDQALQTPAAKARIVRRSTGYDVAVALVDGTLAFAPAAALIDRDGRGSSPRLTLPGDPQAASAAVATALDRMARAIALQRLGDSVAEQSIGFRSTVFVRRAPAGADLADGCPAALEDYAPAEPADAATVFGDCDILAVRMENRGSQPLDVTALLIGRDFSITPVWPDEGAGNRIGIGESRTADLLQMEPYPQSGSEERLVFVAVPGVNRSHVVFDRFEQEGLREAPDDAPAVAGAKALMAAGLGDGAARSASVPAAVEETMAVEVRPFRVGGGETP